MSPDSSAPQTSQTPGDEVLRSALEMLLGASDHSTPALEVVVAVARLVRLCCAPGFHSPGPAPGPAPGIAPGIAPVIAPVIAGPRAPAEPPAVLHRDPAAPRPAAAVAVLGDRSNLREAPRPAVKGAAWGNPVQPLRRANPVIAAAYGSDWTTHRRSAQAVAARATAARETAARATAARATAAAALLTLSAADVPVGLFRGPSRGPSRGSSSSSQSRGSAALGDTGEQHSRDACRASGQSLLGWLLLRVSKVPGAHVLTPSGAHITREDMRELFEEFRESEVIRVPASAGPPGVSARWPRFDDAHIEAAVERLFGVELRWGWVDAPDGVELVYRHVYPGVMFNPGHSPTDRRAATATGKRSAQADEADRGRPVKLQRTHYWCGHSGCSAVYVYRGCYLRHLATHRTPRQSSQRPI